MNIIADKIYINRFDFTRGTNRIENDVQKGEIVAEPHLRSFRMSKQEILHSWLRLVRQIIYHYFVTTGKPVDETKMFQQEVPAACWANVENFIESLTGLSLWVNKDLSLSAFGTKRNNEYWHAVFETGCTPDGAVVMPIGLNLVEMIQSPGQA